MRKLRAISVYFTLLLLTVVAPAAAHPLGNFTINHLARVTATDRGLHVHYVLDIAEIPTFQIMHARSDGPWNDAGLQAWATQEAGVVQDGLRVDVSGSRRPLQPIAAQAAFRAGAGGLPILRWTGEFEVPASSLQALDITVTDGVYADRRIGWKDIVTGTEREPTGDLRRYPSALIGTPRRINAMRFTLENGVLRDVAKTSDAAPPNGTAASWLSSNVLSDLFVRPDQTPLLVLLTILAALGLGALHALEPGHGKALLAFTLVGVRATTRQAMILAVSLTAAHTAGVLLLGIVLFFAAGFVSETIYPWITLVSGAAIAIIGARSLARYVAILRGASHEHHHDRTHSHAHSHAVQGTQPLNFKSAVVAAMSGGIAPCPAAIVVLLAALRLHHLGYGIVLIVIFSIGLAGVLTAIGIAVVHGAAWLSQRSLYGKVAAYGPLLTALVISSIGAWTLSQGFVQQGVAAPAMLLAALTLAAIAGYAFSNRGHVHASGHVHAGESA